jgi:hypothetical protein
MKTRQDRKEAARKSRTEFVPIMNELHKSNMNHRARRMAKAGWGKSPKAGEDWRVRQWRYGMFAHPRRLDRRCRKITGRYLAELASPTAAWEQTHAVQVATKKQSKLRRALGRLGL